MILLIEPNMQRCNANGSLRALLGVDPQGLYVVHRATALQASQLTGSLCNPPWLGRFGLTRPISYETWDLAGFRRFRVAGTGVRAKK